MFFFSREREKERGRETEKERERDGARKRKKKKKKNGGQKPARFFSLTSFFYSSKQLSLPLSLDPKVFPAHQRKLLETVTQLAFPSANGDIHKMAGRLVVRERF